MQRRVFLSVMVVALLGVFSMAQGAEGDKKERDKGKHGEVLRAALEKANLSDDQKAKVKTIQEETATALKAAREAKDREAGMKAMREGMEKTMAVLTDEQKAIVKKYMEENAPHREKGDKGDKKKPE